MTLEEYKEFGHDPSDNSKSPRSCPYCIDGIAPAGYNYPAHVCPDCEGTGLIQPEHEEQ